MYVPVRRVNARAIREARDRAGLTSMEVADAIGIDATAIFHYESGRKSPSVRVLAGFASAYETTMDDLMEVVD